MTILFRDRDGKYASPVDDTLKAAGVDVRKTPVRSPNMAAYIERWSRSLRVDCLDRILALGETHFNYFVREYVEHDNTERPHQSLGNRPLPEAGHTGANGAAIPGRRDRSAPPRTAGRAPEALPPCRVSRLPAANTSTRRARPAPSAGIERPLSHLFARRSILYMVICLPVYAARAFRTAAKLPFCTGWVRDPEPVAHSASPTRTRTWNKPVNSRLLYH